MKRLISGLLCAVLVFALASCKKDEGHDAALTYPIAQAPASLDPQIAVGSGADTAITNSFEGLVRLWEDGSIISGAAKSWEISEDGKTYLFHLREGAKWYYSEANLKLFPEEERDALERSVTAEDFVYGLRRAFSPQIQAPYAQTLFALVNAKEVYEGKKSEDALGVKALDAKTLEIRLKHPSEDLLRLLTTPVAMPCNRVFYEATSGRYGLGHPYLLCNGPFYVYSWNAETAISLRKNPDYAGEKPVLPATLSLQVNPDPYSYAAKVLSGAYSAAALPGDVQQAWAEGFTVLEKPNCVLSLLFQCGSKPFSNTKLRVAMVRIVDRAAIPAANETDTPADGLVPAVCLFGEKGFRAQAGGAAFPTHAQSEAKTLYQQALTELQLTELNAELLCTPEYETAMRKLLQQWQRVFGSSFRVTVKPLEAAQLSSRLEENSYELALAPYYAKEDSAKAFLALFTSQSPENLSHYRSETYDRSYAALAQANTREQELAGLQQLEAHLLQNGVILPLFARNSRYVLGKGISGIVFLPDGVTVCFLSGVKPED